MEITNPQSIILPSSWDGPFLLSQAARIKGQGHVRLRRGEFSVYLIRTKDGLTLSSEGPVYEAPDPNAHFRELWNILLAGAETQEKRIALCWDVLQKLNCGPCKTHWRSVCQAIKGSDVATAESFHRFIFERRQEIRLRKGLPFYEYPGWTDHANGAKELSGEADS